MLALMMLLPCSALAQTGKKALMLTVFGTSTEASVTFDELVPMVQKQFPERDVVVPFTSSIIREKLNAEVSDPAQKILAPADMLAKLKADGYTDIAVVTTVLFPGIEHEKIQAAVDEFIKANPEIKVTYTPPLLTDAANLPPVVDTLQKYILADGFNVVVSHGTHEGHPVEATYLKLAELVSAKYPNALVGSIEGVPDMEEVLEQVEASDAEQVRFIVFMFVAGDHAENDIAGDEEDSLFSAVGAMGKEPSVVMVKTSIGERIASLGLDADYRKLLLDYYVKNVTP